MGEQLRACLAARFRTCWSVLILKHDTCWEIVTIIKEWLNQPVQYNSNHDSHIISKRASFGLELLWGPNMKIYGIFQYKKSQKSSSAGLGLCYKFCRERFKFSFKLSDNKKILWFCRHFLLTLIFHRLLLRSLTASLWVAASLLKVCVTPLSNLVRNEKSSKSWRNG